MTALMPCMTAGWNNKIFILSLAMTLCYVQENKYKFLSLSIDSQSSLGAGREIPCTIMPDNFLDSDKNPASRVQKGLHAEISFTYFTTDDGHVDLLALILIILNVSRYHMHAWPHCPHRRWRISIWTVHTGFWQWASLAMLRNCMHFR